MTLKKKKKVYGHFQQSHLQYSQSLDQGFENFLQDLYQFPLFHCNHRNSVPTPTGSSSPLLIAMLLLTCNLTEWLSRKVPLELVWSNPLLKARSTTAGCSGLCPARFWVFPPDSTIYLGDLLPCLIAWPHWAADRKEELLLVALFSREKMMGDTDWLYGPDPANKSHTGSISLIIIFLGSKMGQK